MKTHGRGSILLALFLASWVSLAAGWVATSQAAPESTSARVDKIFSEWDKPTSPGCALSVMKEGEVVYQRGYGSANLDHGIPITASTVFHVASVSKQFTAFALTWLAQQGKLSLDDDVRTYVPELPDYGRRITLRHLIHHTSGLRDQWDLLHLAGWREDDLITESDILQVVVRQKRLNFTPGDEYVYSNTGYTLMAVIVQRVTGQSLRGFAQAQIFEPLGMSSTHFHDDHAEIVPHRAIAYALGTTGGYQINMPVFDTVGATSLYTTAEDLARWDRNFYEPRVGGRAVLDEMHTRARLNSGDDIDYAHGLVIRTYRGLKTVEHAGRDSGYRAHFLRFPDQRFSVAVLCNLGTIDPGRLARHVADVYLSDQFKEPPASPPVGVQVTPEELAAKAGLYRHAASENILRIELKDGKLIAGREPGQELVPLAPSRFRAKDAPTEFIFLSPDGGKPTQVREVGAGGRPVVYEAVAAASPTVAELAAYAGSYTSRELDATYQVILRDGKLYLNRSKHPASILSPTYVDAFATDRPYGRSSFPDAIKLKFTRDGQGRINGFLLYTGRVRHLRFERQPD